MRLLHLTKEYRQNLLNMTLGQPQFEVIQPIIRLWSDSNTNFRRTVLFPLTNINSDWEWARENREFRVNGADQFTTLKKSDFQ